MSVADAVVVGGGTVGGWCAFLLKRAGVERVVLVERSTVGSGASSRAAGMVRAQGGTEIAVRLGLWSRAFYRAQREEIGVDSGFVEQGYFMPAFDQEEVSAGKARVLMQRAAGLDEVEWLDRGAAESLNPTFARSACLGGTYAPGDGYIDPPRNVLAYALALHGAGVEVRERCELRGLEVDDDRVVAVATGGGRIATERVVLTGGPSLRDVGALAGVVVHAGGARHQVAVTEPHPDLEPSRLGPMVFDVREGLYWRPEEGGLLFGMSNPEEEPGEARAVDWRYLERMRRRLADLVPVTRTLSLRRTWAATIDYTPDHLPILGPAFAAGDPARLIEGVTVASAGGHGMMWGPAVARIAADLALGVEPSIPGAGELGLDRFDAAGRSKLAADPIALPFPGRT